jgi:hypothetical protein
LAVRRPCNQFFGEGKRLKEEQLMFATSKFEIIIKMNAVLEYAETRIAGK